MKKTIFFFYQILFQFAFLFEQTDKPNIIVIIADYLGYADVRLNGCQDISTINIDKIANKI